MSTQPTRREKITAIKARWERMLAVHDELGDLINWLRPAMEDMESILVAEDNRYSRDLIRELVQQATGAPWCGWAYRPDAGRELMQQIGDSAPSGQVEAVSMARQRYPVFLFLGKAGEELLQRYRDGAATEDDVMDATQQAR